MFDLYACMERKHYALDMVEYLTAKDLDKFDISRIPEVVSPSLNFNIPETYIFYINYNKDKISDEEREYYLQIAKSLKEEEKTIFEQALTKLTRSSENISN